MTTLLPTSGVYPARGRPRRSATQGAPFIRTYREIVGQEAGTRRASDVTLLVRASVEDFRESCDPPCGSTRATRRRSRHSR